MNLYLRISISMSISLYIYIYIYLYLYLYICIYIYIYIYIYHAISDFEACPMSHVGFNGMVKHLSTVICLFLWRPHHSIGWHNLACTGISRSSQEPWIYMASLPFSWWEPLTPSFSYQFHSCCLWTENHFASSIFGKKMIQSPMHMLYIISICSNVPFRP